MTAVSGASPASRANPLSSRYPIAQLIASSGSFSAVTELPKTRNTGAASHDSVASM